MSGIIIQDNESAKALQQLAREQMKQRLMQDILFDIEVCRIENWDYFDYLRQLHELIAHFDPCEVTDE